MSDLEFDRVPQELLRALRRRAHQAGVPVRDYVLDLIRQDLAAAERHDWSEKVRCLTPIELGEPSANLIRATRS